MAVRVALPAPMSVVTADDRCTSMSGGDDAAPDGSDELAPAQFYCRPQSVVLAPGQRLMFAFTLRTAGTIRDETGTVHVDLFSENDGVDRDLRNNQAAI